MNPSVLSLSSEAGGKGSGAGPQGNPFWLRLSRKSLWPLWLLGLSLFFWSCEPGGDELLGAGDPASGAVARELVFGLPTNLEFSDEALDELKSYLEARMGIPVRYRIVDGNELLPRLVAVGAIDAALLSAPSLINLLEQKAEILPLLSTLVSATPTYLGHIYVADDSAFRSLDDLKGASMAFVNPESPAGFLMPRALLRSKGHDPDAFFSRIEFMGEHQAVLNAVREGRVDAGAALDSTASSKRPVTSDGLRVIAKTARIPHDAIVVHGSYEVASREAFKDALLELDHRAAETAHILPAFGGSGWTLFRESRYDALRNILRQKGLLGSGP